MESGISRKRRQLGVDVDRQAIGIDREVPSIEEPMDIAAQKKSAMIVMDGIVGVAVEMCRF
jgi:hypothetical protein